MDPFAKYLKEDTFEEEIKALDEEGDAEKKLKYCKEYLELNGLLIFDPKEVPDIGKGRSGAPVRKIAVTKRVQYRSKFTGTMIYDKQVREMKDELMKKLSSQEVIDYDLVKEDDFFGQLTISISV